MYQKIDEDITRFLLCSCSLQVLKSSRWQVARRRVFSYLSVVGEIREYNIVWSAIVGPCLNPKVHHYLVDLAPIQQCVIVSLNCHRNHCVSSMPHLSYNITAVELVAIAASSPLIPGLSTLKLHLFPLKSGI